MLRLPTKDIDDTNSAIGSSLEDMGATAGLVLAGGYKRASVEIRNTHASVAFTDFALLGKTHNGGNWITLISSTAWATIAGRLLDFTGAPHTLAAETSAEVFLDVSSLHAIKFQGKTGSSGTGFVKGTVVE